MGPSGDGGAATSAQLYNPTGVAANINGNVYIADQVNHRVRMVTAAGIMTTFAGTGTAGYNGDGVLATSTQLNYPCGISADINGNVYIADYNNNRIRMVNSAGIVSTFAGTETAGSNGDGVAATLAQLNNPYGVSADINGNVYIADQANQRIRKVNAEGILTTFAGTGTAGSSGDGGAATSAQLNNPFGVSADINGNVYIADTNNNRILFVGIPSQPVSRPTMLPSGQPTLLPSLQQSSTVPVTWVSSDLSQDCISACGTLGSAYSCYLPAMWAVDSLAKTQALGCSGSYPRTLSDGWNGMVPFVSSMDPGDCYFNIPGQQQSTCEGSHIYRHRYCACSLHKNPVIQTGQPTAQPTGRATRFHPTSNAMVPTSQPTRQPTGHPTTRPTARQQQVT